MRAGHNGSCRLVATACLASCLLLGLGAASASAAFTLEAQQRIAGYKEPWTTAPMAGVVGQTVEYRVIMRTTERRWRLTHVVDEQCGIDHSYGPKTTEEPLLISGRTIIECTHVLTAEDQANGSFDNDATVTAHRTQGPTETRTSNTTVMNVPPGTPDPMFTRELSCAAVTYNFSGFPEWTGNTAKEQLRVDGVLSERTFVFDGPAGSDTVPLELAPGHHGINVRATWRTNGVEGAGSISGTVTCP
jgi:hypothetical protein